MELNIMNLIFMVPALLFAVIIHELGHGIVAYRLGDPTPKLAGRLTFNPIPHIDPLGSIILPALMVLLKFPFIFGWARPIPVNAWNFKKLGYRKGMAVTAFAGPGVNFVAAVLFGILYQILSSPQLLITLNETVGRGFIDSVLTPILIFLKYSVSINIILAIFNLLPIPPLDGGRILMSILPPQMEQKLEPLEQWGFFIVILLMIAGLFKYVVLPPYLFFTSILLGY
ncbi:Zn-dependent protease (includes SpoIVFB) [Persephonella hydrogeniphila]|uniref:Zn-dependent protease (Includes SpoIVFB) n=1 Tax=Persephonella hydrogeniphila TaxID=198703 RepID=A0A285NEG3_9AQUI|nr:site-2 protease family protein [Persephonella hydrogeniphila]SNZ07839.1 Zn-dependent protease (includes SpoIVFB) [Persephonella hydrogeniphila]